MKVYECPRCGRFWVRGYDPMDYADGYTPHAHMEVSPGINNGRRCYEPPVEVDRPDVLAARELGGWEVVRAMQKGWPG